jgi:aflatoxin B1 aldehyde reductase
MTKAPITNIIFGTMTLGYRGYGARVHDAETAEAMLGTVLEFGHDQLDTCSVYGDGTCEQMLGDLRATERFRIAARVPSGNTRGHELHDEGLFEEFGLSNFSAWHVAEALEKAANHGWIRPSVYQGMYNAITRAVEPELLKCLAHYGIRFHAFNPLAGGAFSKNFGASAEVAPRSRFDGSTAQGKVYRNRYMNDAYLDALAEIHRSCEGHGLDAISVALRLFLSFQEVGGCWFHS